MARAGDRFEMPDGSTYEVTASSADTNGEAVEMVFTLPPGSFAPPPHIHDSPVEEYEVLEGELHLMVDGSWRTLRVGDSASVPAGSVHTFKNRSDQVVRVANAHRPAARFEDYIEHTNLLLDARGVKGLRDPRLPIYLSMLMLEYPETLRPARARERIGMTALARLGRLLGLSTDL
jgi:quercetin dioxygenase-like cupin family protein